MSNSLKFCLSVNISGFCLQNAVTKLSTVLQFSERKAINSQPDRGTAGRAQGSELPASFCSHSKGLQTQTWQQKRKKATGNSENKWKKWLHLTELLNGLCSLLGSEDAAVLGDEVTAFQRSQHAAPAEGGSAAGSGCPGSISQLFPWCPGLNPTAGWDCSRLAAGNRGLSTVLMQVDEKSVILWVFQGMEQL